MKEIILTDSLALTAIIDYWKENNATTVLLAYAELKRRSHSIDTRLTNRLIDFCSANGNTDIESLLFDKIKTYGFNNYIEYYENITEAKNAEQPKSNNYNSKLTINPNNIVSAGRNIKNIVYVVLVMIVFSTLAVLYINSSRDLDNIKISYTLLGVLGLICNIIILLCLHSAGEKLEKSVYEKVE